MLGIAQLIKRPLLRSPLLRGTDLDRNSAAELTRTILERLLQGRKVSNLNVRLWDDTMWPDDEARLSIYQALLAKLKQKWAQLTDDDLQYADGKNDELIGRIQKRTGETREAIEKAISDSFSY